MGIRDRLQEQALRAGKRAQVVAADHAQRAGESLRGFREVLADEDQVLSVEAYLVALVRAVRDDEDDDWSMRDLYVRARKRRRRLGLLAIGTGPLAGVVNRAADLYCETATVCDISELHDLGLDDEQIAARMLVLWSVVDDRAQAEAAMGGEPALAKLLEAKLRGTEFAARASQVLPEELTKRTVGKMLWEVQELDLGDAILDGKRATKGQPIRTVAFTGQRMKKFIKRAEAELAVSPEPPGLFRWR